MMVKHLFLLTISLKIEFECFRSYFVHLFSSFCSLGEQWIWYVQSINKLPGTFSLFMLHLRDVLIVKNKSMLDIPLVCIDVGHSDDFHPWAEVSAGRHVLTHVHRAAHLGERTDPLLRRQTAVTVLRHAVSCLQINNTLSTHCTEFIKLLSLGGVICIERLMVLL